MDAKPQRANLSRSCMHGTLGNLNPAAPRKQKCTRCGANLEVRAYTSQLPDLRWPAAPVCESCTDILATLNKFMTLNRLARGGA